MNAAWNDRIYVMPALLSDLVPAELPGDDHGSFMRLSKRGGEWTAVSWSPVAFPDSALHLLVGEVTVFDGREDLQRDPLTLVKWSPLETEAILDVIPDHCCPIPDVVIQTCDLIKNVQTPVLRKLLSGALAISTVHERYWTYPASLAHHHAWPGGLAVHSLQVAVAAGSVQGLDSWQRDLVVAYALLHDVGKVWAYENGRLTEDARHAGHAALGYRYFTSSLALHHEQDPDTCSVLDELISGRWKKNFRRPAAALGEIVRAMDRFSAACDIENCPADRTARPK